MSIPNVVKVIQNEGSISDELDYALMNYLLQNRGPGFTACKPSMVELEGRNKAIKMNIDHTFVDKSNKLMGLGIVGTMYIEYDNFKVLYCTPKAELDANIKKLKETGIQPQPRPKGKY